MKLKPILTILLAAGLASNVHAEICNSQPGSMTCGKGEINNLKGNGMVTINGTTVTGVTIVNGVLNATDCSLNTLDVNGTGSLMQCTINDNAEIKGSLSASSSKFEHGLNVHSNVTRFINSKVNDNLTIHHSGHKEQIVYLDNHSEVNGDIIFEDKNGKVIIRGGSEVKGNVHGGQIINN